MPENYNVKSGDCMRSIAQRRGFNWETLWEHPENAKLKKMRKNPGALLPGDKVHVPDLRVIEESCSTENRYRFRKLQHSAELRLRILKQPDEQDELIESEAKDHSEYIETDVAAEQPEPAANVKCSVFVDGKWLQTTSTDGDGCISAMIRQDAMNARLVLNPGEWNERTLELNLGHMDPIEELQGACKRLYNLGYQCPTTENELSESIGFAIRAFQTDYDLEPSGLMDEATLSKLEEVFGC